MPAPVTLGLGSVVNVVVSAAAPAAPRSSFNQGLIVGPTAAISAATRVKKYTYDSWQASMIADGFTVNSPEYIAVGMYFGDPTKTPSPKAVWVGRQDLTAAETVDVDAGGAGYAVGDVLAVAGGLTVKVLTVNAGAVLTVSILTKGTGYVAAENNATTGGSGNGCQIGILTVGETLTEAIQACRSADFDWWGVYAPGAAKADHIAIATAVAAMVPTSFYFGNTSDADALSGAAGNVLSSIKALAYNRNSLIYSTTQGGVYANNAYAGAALMGVIMGLNTGLANSAFTAKFKPLPGIATEPLQSSDLSTIEGNGGNAYVSYGNFYNWFVEGFCGDGATFIDQILFRDMLANFIQLNIADLFNQTPKVPQTDDGAAMIVRACKQACEVMATIGYIGPGSWTLAPVMNLETGDALPDGYIVQVPAMNTLSNADKSARKMPPIYVCINEAGAGHSVVIQVDIN